MSNYAAHFVTGFNGFRQFSDFIRKDVTSSPTCTDKEHQQYGDLNNEKKTREPGELSVCFAQPVQFEKPTYFLFSWSSAFSADSIDDERLVVHGYKKPARSSKLEESLALTSDLKLDDRKASKEFWIPDSQHVRVEYPDCPRGLTSCPFNLMKDSLANMCDNVFVITDEAEVYTNQLMEQRNGNSCKERCDLRRFTIFNDLIVTSVSCGKEHTLFLANRNVYTSGSGSRGQLGIGSLESHKQPMLVETLQPLFVKSVVAGGWHSFALTDTGDLYSWGWNQSGQLGIGCFDEDEPFGKPKSCSTEDTCKRMMFGVLPNLIDFDAEVISVSSGSRHSAAVLKDNSLWTWGWNGYGQLGHCDKRDRHCPCMVQGLIKSRLIDVMCSAWTTVISLVDMQTMI